MRIYILLLDLLIFLLTVFAVLKVRYLDFTVPFFINNCKVMIPVFFIITIVLFIFSFYDLKTLYKRQKDYINIAMAFIITFLFSATGIYFGVNIVNIVTPKTNLIYVFIIYFVYIYISRKLYTVLNLAKTNIISFGTGAALNKIKRELLSLPNYNLSYEFKDIEEFKNSKINIDIKDIDLVLLQNKLLYNNKKTLELIAEKFINRGTLLKIDLDFFEELFLKVPKEGLKDDMWLLLGVSAREKHMFYPVIKRLLDVTISLALIPFCLPIGIIIYILIKFIDKQPPFFLQKRVGIGEKDIYIYKFRTMISDTERPTRLGNILRRFRLDEIPQLLNILKGDIAIAGPRPVWTEEYKYLNAFIPNHPLRVIIKPGLTGWAQLNFKAPPVYCVLSKPVFKNDEEQEEYFKDAIIRFAYDLWYIKNYSFFLDLEILFKTIRRMFIKDKHVSQ
ncbi:MAG: sugar transferase [Endomicrobiaceae bacterium]|nr:sugar transferase [Endomicrobiaceae bacterium]